MIVGGEARDIHKALEIKRSYTLDEEQIKSEIKNIMNDLETLNKTLENLETNVKGAQKKRRESEKKRNEILQMAVLEPSLAILDETDSGLDVDALKIVGEGVTSLRAPDRAMLVITHYQRLLDHIVPDFVHVLANGRIQRSGGKELALELEENGYAEFIEAA